MSKQISTDFSFKLKTQNGYDMFECSSALQKAIRRGDERVAMFFAVELWKSNYGEYVWKRLKIITSEDVGLAEPNMPAVIQSLYTMYVEQTKKSDGKHNPERLFLTHAVIGLCRAKKSRLLDWAVISYWDEHDGDLIEIPDYAFDKHNIKGRKMGRGWAHFFDEGSKLENHEVLPLEEEYKERSRVCRMGGKTPDDELEQTPLF